jgi:AcrR family transcriptional regulator
MTRESPETKADTRQRLIEAASEIFIEHGYKAAKIRDIVRRAGANVAAVNYHFNGKEGLYAEVIRHHAAQAIEDFAHAAAEEPRAPEAQLRNYIRTFLKRLLGNNVQSRMARLIARESVEPSAAFNLVVEQFVIPQHVALHNTVRAIVGVEASEESVRRCSMSVIGQCLYYWSARRVVHRLDPELNYNEDEVGRIADHIAEFSLAGMRRVTGGPAAQARGRAGAG